MQRQYPPCPKLKELSKGVCLNFMRNNVPHPTRGSRHLNTLNGSTADQLGEHGNRMPIEVRSDRRFSKLRQTPSCSQPRRSWTLLSRGPDPQIPTFLRDQELFGASGRSYFFSLPRVHTRSIHLSPNDLPPSLLTPSTLVEGLRSTKTPQPPRNSASCVRFTCCILKRCTRAGYSAGCGPQGAVVKPKH